MIPGKNSGGRLPPIKGKPAVVYHAIGEAGSFCILFPHCVLYFSAEIFRTLHDGISTEDGTVCEMPVPEEALFTLDTVASVQVSVNGLGFTYEPVNRLL